MTLANLGLLLYFLASVSNMVPQPTQATSTQAAQDTPSRQAATEEKPASEPAQSKASTRTPPKSGAAKKPTRKKRAAATSPCVTPSTASTPTNSTPQNAPADPAEGASPPAAAMPQASKDCPPPKIVVRQGGSKESSIQLAGGNADHGTAQQRDGINQLLGQTDENLKKAEATQLTSSQQDIVTQTRQYVVQSKTAMANGDFERAHTLAWKAQLLSQDLVKVEK